MEIDKLPPEVAEAIGALSALFSLGPESPDSEYFRLIRAHLHRLAEENARLREESRLAHSRWSEFAQLSGAEQRKRISAEAERDALKTRFAEAPVVTVRDVYAIAAFPFARIDAATMDRRVHLVVEDGERE